MRSFIDSCPFLGRGILQIVARGRDLFRTQEIHPRFASDGRPDHNDFRWSMDFGETTPADQLAQSCKIFSYQIDLLIGLFQGFNVKEENIVLPQDQLNGPNKNLQGKLITFYVKVSVE